MTSGPDGVAGGGPVWQAAPQFGLGRGMRRYGYVAQVLGLLIGFYVMCAALVAGLIAVTAFAVAR